MADDVTLGEVARKSGVSMAAASRALNSKDGVRPEVRDRVRLVAEALGYRPNRAARNLAGGRSSVVGFVVGSGELRLDSYGASLVQSMARAADAHDEGLMLLMDSKEPNVAVQNLIGDGLIDGVIVSAVAIGERWVEELLDARVPTVLVGEHPRRSDVSVVNVENCESSAQIVGHLLDTGCRSVATVTGPMTRVDASLRLQGYRLAHERRGLEIDERMIFHSDFDRRSGYELTETVVACGADGVFGSNDEMSLGLMRGFGERGIKMPDDIAIAGFDGTSETEQGVPALTTVLQPFQEIANTAIETLLRLMEDSDPPPLEQLVIPEIFFGETTRNPQPGEG